MTVRISAATSVGGTDHLAIASGAQTESAPGHRPAGMPALVPASELYFWSAKWQSQEHDFERDRAAGKLVAADSIDELVRGLFTVDED